LDNKKESRGRENNRSKIIETAIRLIGEKGVEGASLADISKEVGISKGTLYYYYTSKNDLIFEITEIHMEKITQGLFSLIEKNQKGTSLKDLLTLLIERLLQSETRTRLHLYLIQEVISGNQELKQRFIKTYNQWFKLIEDASNLLNLKIKDISVYSRILVSVIDGLIIQASIGTGEICIDEIASDLSRLVIDDK
jgi:AcrR family transcriptional regulator